MNSPSIKKEFVKIGPEMGVIMGIIMRGASLWKLKGNASGFVVRAGAPSTRAIIVHIGAP